MIETPYYIAYESKIEKNLSLIKHVSEESGAAVSCGIVIGAAPHPARTTAASRQNRDRSFFFMVIAPLFSLLFAYTYLIGTRRCKLQEKTIIFCVSAAQ